MPIYVNVEKRPSPKVEFEEFCEKLFEMLQNAEIEIYRESGDTDDLYEFYKDGMNYQKGVDYYKDKELYWNGYCFEGETA